MDRRQPVDNLNFRLIILVDWRLCPRDEVEDALVGRWHGVRVAMGGREW